MKTNIHKAAQRGSGYYGWLKTHYSFSFANYFNADRVGFGALRVLNDDEIAAGHGFPTHPHENMEIVTIVLEGALAHKDNSGGQGVIKVGEVQAMTAGTGVEHSEYNASKEKPAKLLQLWITPRNDGFKPSYSQKKFSFPKNKLVVVASGSKEGLLIQQDAKLSMGDFDAGRNINYKLSKGNGLFLFVIEGGAKISGNVLEKRDSIEISGSPSVDIETTAKSHLLLIEVPMKV